ncbi:MAG TPA: transcription antitermination factor NusB, partial [Methylomirabilota bacterium]|nr:transcription antitermination factor NusB [Methylomirabilota bacterium]
MTVLADEAKNVRALAAEILRKVDVRKAYADALLDHTLKSRLLNDADRALLTELVYGTLRWRGRVDALLIPHLSRPLEKTDPLVRNLLRLAVYQLLFLDRIPAYAAVNEAVTVAKSLRGAKAAGFANAVLRNFLRKKRSAKKLTGRDDSVQSLAVAYSHPEWLVQKWL